MKRFIAAVAVLCLPACVERRSIRAERFVHTADSDLTGVMLERRSKALVVREVCEVGAKAYCFGPGPAVPGGGPLYKHCVRGANGRAFWSTTECNTPLVVAFDASPVEFTRVDVPFAIGLGERTEWVSARTPWLALDRDGSGCIESARELFAGFGALAELDANGDGLVDAQDPAFAELVLWADGDQDKRCSPNELSPLSSRVDALPLAFTDRAPALGSYEGETTSLARGGRLVDVHLAPLY